MLFKTCTTDTHVQEAYTQRINALENTSSSDSKDKWNQFLKNAKETGDIIYSLKAVYEKKGTLSGYIQLHNPQKNDTALHLSIVLKGTHNLKTAKIDLKAWLRSDASSGGKAHKGFQEHWHALEVETLEIMNTILNNKKCKKEDIKIVIIGHSLGGAAAQLLAQSLHNHGFDVVEVSTFGAPKAYNKDGAAAYDKALGDKTYHFTQEGDVVHKLGPVSFSHKTGLKTGKRTGMRFKVKRTPKSYRHLIKGFKWSKPPNVKKMLKKKEKMSS